MTVKLRCAATGDLLLLSATAKDLLGLLGKAPEQGIIEPPDMPAALDKLKALSDDAARHPPAGADNKADSETDQSDPSEEPAFSDQAVSLRQRAWPLIQMIERAQAANKSIVWGV